MCMLGSCLTVSAVTASQKEVGARKGVHLFMKALHGQLGKSMTSQVFTTPYAGRTSVEAYGPCDYHAVQPPHSVSRHSKKGVHLFMKALHRQLDQPCCAATSQCEQSQQERGAPVYEGLP